MVSIASLSVHHTPSEFLYRSIGGPVSSFPDLATAKRVQIDYGVAAAKAFAEHVLPRSPSGKFRLVFCSAALACRDNQKKLWFESDTRHIKVGHSPRLMQPGKELTEPGPSRAWLD